MFFLSLHFLSIIIHTYIYKPERITVRAYNIAFVSYINNTYVGYILSVGNFQLLAEVTKIRIVTLECHFTYTVTALNVI